MVKFSPTARGRVTYGKDDLPLRRATRRAAKSSGSIDDFIGLLANKTNKVATLDEIGDAAAAGWAAVGSQAARTAQP